ncbi:hypothetical protein Pelo_11470 [Pelomyxa schiedti]|nr:hypothetical protein Pelo_11470 [Pelomyxa schiedti]
MCAFKTNLYEVGEDVDVADDDEDDEDEGWCEEGEDGDERDRGTPPVSAGEDVDVECEMGVPAPLPGGDMTALALVRRAPGGASAAEPGDAALLAPAPLWGMKRWAACLSEMNEVEWVSGGELPPPKRRGEPGDVDEEEEEPVEGA